MASSSCIRRGQKAVKCNFQQKKWAIKVLEIEIFPAKMRALWLF